MMFGSIYMSVLYSSTSGGRFILYFFIEVLNSIIEKQICFTKQQDESFVLISVYSSMSEITDMSTAKLIDQKQTRNKLKSAFKNHCKHLYVCDFHYEWHYIKQISKSMKISIFMLRHSVLHTVRPMTRRHRNYSIAINIQILNVEFVDFLI